MIALSCLACRTPLTTLALTDDDAARAANSGETCCAAPESPAGRLDPISSAGVLGEAAPVEVHADLSVAPTRTRRQAARVESAPTPLVATQRRGLLSGVPVWVGRRVGVL